jgi:antitoxin component YwqK of YwqJK toxin-antitoxin module
VSINWYQGKIQGLVKTYYPDGSIESQKEMANNKKNGLFSAWYRDGGVMMMEEYDQGKLVRGEYYAQGSKLPLSTIQNGKGIATIHDAEGHFVRKINYLNGKPND